MTMQENMAATLKNFKINNNDYLTWLIQLTEIGYTIEQTDKLILRPSARKGIEGVLNYTDKLFPQFTHQQIIALAIRHGGYQNLRTVVETQERLITYGFSTDDIVRIAGNMGGSKNVIAVLFRIEALRELYLTPSHIAKIAGHPGGSSIVEAVIKAKKTFIALGFTADDIVRLAGTHYGLKNMAVFSGYQLEMLAMSRSVKDTINFVLKNVKLQKKNKTSKLGIKKKIKKQSAKLPKLQSNELKAETSMVSEIASIPALDTIMQTRDTFIGCNQHMLFRSNLVLKHTSINAEIYSNMGDQLNLFKIDNQDYVEWKTHLLALGYAENQANQIILRESPYHLIQFLLKYTPLLFIKFDGDQIIQMLSSSDGFENIKIAINFQAATFFHFSPGQLVSIVSHPLGYQNLESIRFAQFTLFNLGFDSNQLVKIAGKEKGFQDIEAIAKLSAELTMNEISARQITEVMINSSNGEDALNELIKTSSNDCFSSIDFQTMSLTSPVVPSAEDTQINWHVDPTLHDYRAYMMFGENNTQTKSQDEQVQKKVNFSM